MRGSFRKNIWIWLVSIVLLLIVLPAPLSLVLEKISELEIFPRFSKPKFYEEYFKFIGTLFAMIIGFWYADALIEIRTQRNERKKLEKLMMKLSELEQLVKKIKDCSECGDAEVIKSLKLDYEGVFETVMACLENHYHKHHLSGAQRELFWLLKREGGNLFTNRFGNPIDSKIADRILETFGRDILEGVK